MERINIEEFLHKKTLIVGDIAKGKTKLTAFLVKKLIVNGYGNFITILDLAPERRDKIGGKIRDFIDVKNIRYLTTNILGPRMNAKNIEELYDISRRNKNSIEKLFNIYEEKPSKILVINDLTLYLHAGDIERLLNLIRLSETFIGNAYKGKSFEIEIFKEFNQKERELVERIERLMDIVIELF